MPRSSFSRITWSRSDPTSTSIGNMTRHTRGRGARLPLSTVGGPRSVLHGVVLWMTEISNGHRSASNLFLGRTSAALSRTTGRSTAHTPKRCTLRSHSRQSGRRRIRRTSIVSWRSGAFSGREDHYSSYRGGECQGASDIYSSLVVNGRSRWYLRVAPTRDRRSRKAANGSICRHRAFCIRYRTAA